MEGLLSPRLNTDVINVFLEQFAATLTEDEHAVMLWDGAGDSGQAVASGPYFVHLTVDGSSQVRKIMLLR